MTNVATRSQLEEVVSGRSCLQNLVEAEACLPGNLAFATHTGHIQEARIRTAVVAVASVRIDLDIAVFVERILAEAA